MAGERDRRNDEVFHELISQGNTAIVQLNLRLHGGIVLKLSGQDNHIRFRGEGCEGMRNLYEVER